MGKAETFRKIEKRETISRVNEKFISMGAVWLLPHHILRPMANYVWITKIVNYVHLILDHELFALFAYSFLGDMQWHRIAGYFPIPRLLPSEKKKQFLFFFIFFCKIQFEDALNQWITVCDSKFFSVKSDYMKSGVGHNWFG